MPLHQLLDARPSPVDLPAGKPLVAGLPWPITLGEVPPGRTGPGPPDDAVDHLAVVMPAATPLASWRQQRPQPLESSARPMAHCDHTSAPSENHALGPAGLALLDPGGDALAAVVGEDGPPPGLVLDLPCRLQPQVRAPLPRPLAH